MAAILIENGTLIDGTGAEPRPHYPPCVSHPPCSDIRTVASVQQDTDAGRLLVGSAPSNPRESADRRPGQESGKRPRMRIIRTAWRDTQ